MVGSVIQAINHLNYYFKITLPGGAVVSPTKSGATCKGRLLDENSKQYKFEHGVPPVVNEYVAPPGVISAFYSFLSSLHSLVKAAVSGFNTLKFAFCI